MKIIVNQPFGIGDCIYAQTLVHRIADGRDIIWPVMKHFVDGLSRAYPHITWLDFKTVQVDFNRRDQYEFEHHEWGRCTVLPVRWTTENMRLSYDRCMASKYEYWGMDYREWKERAMWKIPDRTNEMIIAQQAITHVGSENVTFVNRIFGSDSKLRVNIPVQNNEFSTEDVKDNCKRFSLFDYSLLLVNATEIHTVNTSILYLIDLLDLAAPEVHVYPRSIKGQTHDGVSYLFNRHKYIWHE